jgi:hypothetical protein
MSDFVNAGGRGPIGTPTNSPISDGGTMARTQNKANVSQGKSADVEGTGLFSSSFTDADRQFLYDIHHSKHLDGTPLRLDELVFLRGENVRMQQQAIREFGAGSKTAAWFEEVIAAYDEEIEKGKSPLGSASNALRTLLADPSAKEEDMADKMRTMIGAMRQEQLLGVEDDPAAQEASDLMVKVIDRSTEQRTAILEDLVKREKASSGAIPDEKFRDAIRVVMGIERQRQLLGMDDDGEGAKKGDRVSHAVTEVIHLVSERRIKSLKALIDEEKKSMGSVSDKKFQELLAAVLGDERQKQLMGLSDDDSGGLQAVVDVMDLILNRRKAAVADLFKRQAIPGSGVTNEQVNRAVNDYGDIKQHARRLGMAVPDGDFTLGKPEFSKE